ncbi:10722_t:CDS:1, partial [Acaulospora morrowiae]
YPHALYFLDLLENPSFRENLKNLEKTKLISHKQYYHWYNWRNVFGTAGEGNAENMIQNNPGNGYQDVENGLQSSGPSVGGLNGRGASDLDNIF